MMARAVCTALCTAAFQESRSGVCERSLAREPLVKVQATYLQLAVSPAQVFWAAQDHTCHNFCLRNPESTGRPRFLAVWRRRKSLRSAHPRMTLASSKSNLILALAAMSRTFSGSWMSRRPSCTAAARVVARGHEETTGLASGHLRRECQSSPRYGVRSHTDHSVQGTQDGPARIRHVLWFTHKIGPLKRSRMLQELSRYPGLCKVDGGGVYLTQLNALGGHWPFLVCKGEVSVAADA